MKASTPSKVGENAHKITKGVNLANLWRGGGGVQGFDEHGRQQKC
jgi:hypothetical protein